MADMEVDIVVVAAAAAVAEVAEVAEVSSTSFYPMMGLTKVVVGKRLYFFQFGSSRRKSALVDACSSQGNSP